MEFGKIQNVDSVDFTLPNDHISVTKVLGGIKSPLTKIYIGAPVWKELGWVGKIYPLKAQEQNSLMYYAQQFNTIELNATHYMIPSIDTINRWKISVNANFKFSPKVPQIISHAANIVDKINLMQEFYERVTLFENNLGTIFLQLPSRFLSNQFHLLKKFIEHIPVDVDWAIELRNETWFDSSSKVFNELCNLLYKRNIGLVITDVAGRRDLLHMRLPNKTALIRFDANNLHPSDFARLNDWAKRITEWINKGVEQVYFFIHTPNVALTPELTIHFIDQLKSLTNIGDIHKPVLLKTETNNTLFGLLS